MRKLILFALTACSISGLAHAEPNCKGRMLSDKYDYYKKGAVIEDMYAAYDDDTKWDEKTQTMVTRKFQTLQMPTYYTVHGGTQYDAKDIKILNCHLIPNPESNTYSLELDDNSANARDILRAKIEEKLEAAGVNHALASNSAPAAYLERPRSACGIAVARVIAGEASAGSLVAEICN